jgi:hypothetical protein
LQERLPGEKTYTEELTKLAQLTEAVSKRCRETEFESAVGWCDSVLAAVEGLELNVDRNASMHLLGHAALNLNQVFQPEKATTDHLSKIDATVAMIRARMQTLAVRDPAAKSESRAASGEQRRRRDGIRSPRQIS